LATYNNVITDTRVTVETPEGADLPLDPAGAGVRIAAFLVDAVIKFVVSMAAAIVFMLAGGVGIGLYLILYFLLEWFYPVLFEVWKKGQTPGKKYMGIAVVNDDGTPVTFAASLIRNLLRVVDFLPLAYVVGIITSTCSPQFKRVGDLAAGTIVIYCHEKMEAPELDTLDKRPIPVGFTTDEQRALLNFAERSPQLSKERQHELANILAPIVGETDTVETLKKMANSLVGGR